MTTIPCELHDYLEIACMYGYRLELTLKDRSTIAGLALNIISKTDQGEFLLIENEGTHAIPVHQLRQLKVLTPNAKFLAVEF